jgi:hypothetical protein
MIAFIAPPALFASLAVLALIWSPFAMPGVM